MLFSQVRLLKKGWFKACRAVSRSDGSYINKPFNKSVRENLEDSTCWDTRSCMKQHYSSPHKNLLDIPQHTPLVPQKIKKKWGKVTFRRSSLLTALILSLETAPSGQFSRNPRLKYFSAPLLHMIIKQAKHVNTWYKNLNYILQHTDTNYFSVSERDLSGNAFINYQMGLVNTK